MSSEPVAQRFSTLGWEAFPWWAQNSEQFGRVTRDFALSVSSVLGARNIVCGTIGSLPIRVLDSENNIIRSPLLSQIDPDVANPVTMASLVEDVIFESIGWLRVLARDFDNYPVKARRIDPSVVSAQPPPGYILADLPSGFVPGSTLWVGGEPVQARDMLRFDSPNPPLLVAGARTFRRASKLEAAAEMYADEPAPRMWLTPADNSEPLQKEIDATISDWESRRKAHAMGYVPGTFNLNESKGFTPVELQLSTLIEKATVAVANVFGLDSEDVNVSTTSRTYSNAVDRRYDKVNETYGPLVVAIAARLSMGDVTRPDQRVEFDWSKFLTPNPIDRASVHATYIDKKVITAEEARHDEGKAPFTDEQKAELKPKPAPMAAPAFAPALPPGQNPEVEPPSNVVPFRKPANFAAEPVGLTFDLSDVEDGFHVDVNRRTITGLVMPWGEIGRSGGLKWRFVPGALKYSPGKVAQIKFMVDHSPTQPVGYTVRAWSDERGQWATYKVGRGPAGDQALQDAADRVRDGLSAGIGFAADESDIVWVPDPSDPTVRLVTSAPWRETSLVALPAFAGARVSAVSMAADPQGVAMTAPVTEPQAQPAAQGAAVTFSAEQFAQFMAAHSAPTAPEPATAPAVVNPTALPIPTNTAQAQVNEQPLYRFDGNPAQRSFIADMRDQFNGDRELRAKAEQFLADAMAAAFANIATTDVNEHNPNIQRPDLYVPRLTFSRPMGVMTTGGVVASITKSTLPKFSSAAGLAATHSEGGEPTEGTFVSTSQEITPVPISGLLKVNREVIDQGGSPQVDQVMWNVMTQYYAELLENRLEALLDGLSLTPQAVVGVDELLSSSLLAKFTALQYIRGGDRYSAWAIHSAFFSALAGAVDADGRPLFPMDGPTNVNGQLAGDLSTCRAHGKRAVPAWPLETANGGPATPVSYLWVPSSVYQWFSPPRRIDLSAIAVSRVEIGIWGYSAEFAIRDTDVIELTYAVA